MPRTGSVYTIPAGTLKPAVTGTTISSSDWNAFITDLEQAISDSAIAAGLVFTGQIEFDPTAPAGAPAITFTGDLDTGIFQKAANEVGVATGGVERVLVKNTGVDVTGDLAVSGDLAVTGSYGLTAADMPAVGEQVSGTMTVFTTSSVSYVDVTDGAEVLTVTITTSGRPVMLIVQPISSAAGGIIISTGAGGFGSGYAQFMRGVSDSVAQFSCAIPSINNQHDFPSMVAVDVVGAGTYTYKVQARVANANVAFGAAGLKLIAYEL